MDKWKKQDEHVNEGVLFVYAVLVSLFLFLSQTLTLAHIGPLAHTCLGFAQKGRPPHSTIVRQSHTFFSRMNAMKMVWAELYPLLTYLLEFFLLPSMVSIHEEVIGPCKSKKELTGTSQPINNSVLLLPFLIFMSTQQRKETKGKLQDESFIQLAS